MNWEYHTEQFDTDEGMLSGISLNTDALNEKLNQLGNDGWEMVSAFDINYSQGGSKQVVAIFKRPKKV